MGEDQGSKREQETSNSPEQTGNTNRKTARSSEEKKSSWLDTILLTILIVIVFHSGAFLYLTFFSAIHQNQTDSDIQQAIEISTKAQRNILTLLAYDNKNLPIETKEKLVDTLAWIAQAKKDINKENNNLLDTKQSVYTNFWQIFSLLIVLGGAVGLGAYKLMKHDLLSTAENHIQERADKCEEDLKNRVNECIKGINECIEGIEDHIDKRISYGSLRAEAKAYQGMSYTFWKHYNIYFKDVVRIDDEKEKKECCMAAIRDLKLAKHMAALGFERLEQIEEMESKKSISIRPHDKDTIFKIEILLLNDTVYHYTMERIFNVIKNNPQKNPWEVLKEPAEDQNTPHDEFLEGKYFANDLLLKSKDKRAKDNWYVFHDSAGFYFAISPQEKDRQKGREILEGVILNGVGPDGRPAPDWAKQKIRNEHEEQLNLQLSKPQPANDSHGAQSGP